MTHTDKENDALARIAAALERLAPAVKASPDWQGAEAFVWSAADGNLDTIAEVARVPLALLKGIDRQRDILLANTTRFAKGLPARSLAPELIVAVKGRLGVRLLAALNVAVTPA